MDNLNPVDYIDSAKEICGIVERRAYPPKTVAEYLYRLFADKDAELEQCRQVLSNTRITSTNAMNEIRAAAGAPQSQDDKSQKRAVDYVIELRTEINHLRSALRPFAQYAQKHGAYRLVGQNGAEISADDWFRAAILTETP